jgi:hypothetical protein
MQLHCLENKRFFESALPQLMTALKEQQISWQPTLVIYAETEAQQLRAILVLDSCKAGTEFAELFTSSREAFYVIHTDVQDEAEMLTALQESELPYCTLE